MIKVLIPSDADFQKYESRLKELYEKNQKNICDTNTYEFIRDETLFYAFLKINGELIGAIYYFMDKGKLFLNAFSNRKMFSENIKSLLMSLTWFSCDIYAEAQNRASALCLLRCGFKRIEDNLFVYKKNIERK